ncbi:hypothetical protein LVY72_21000 [Arthrobacter sp. I2-34]|uniref:Uncharacterized protein n=1 Tax=Arthrobacter hankyongi TaxID=2904801 RepID=A0ABS9LD12_9MICC|nr:hypothetical protein [Arthrobacter hankyongi]MCG2624374.1 hypothetical protein [Arthrobacter hankyongi]
MELTAFPHRSGDSWVVDVPEVPGLTTRAQRINGIVDAVAEEYERLTGGLPDRFLVAPENSWMK